MTVQRIYNMPSCNLLVEGISLGDSDQLSMLTNFKCTFNHTQDAIVGGKELLSALTKCASNYAQALQAGNLITTEAEAVRIEPENSYNHSLHIAAAIDQPNQPQDQAGSAKQDGMVEIKLNTVQFFDLVESLDRLCAEEQALQDLKAPLDLTKVRGKVNFQEKLVPAIGGIASFAIVAFGFFLLPVPEPIPEPQLQQQTSSENTNNNNLEQTPPQPDAPEQSNTNQSENDPTVAATPTPLPEAIEDADLDALAQSLREQIDDNWSVAIEEDVTFTVAVNEAGEVVGYRPTDVPEGIPLPDLLVIETDPETGASPEQPQRSVSFEVTFYGNGDLDIEPVQ
ncbi:hypothetical protein Pse7367_2434 [Thalassoporum mexicanum PCC 7367]|uniref:DUF4335 domain-containing protein n=1 Tax=Thalassoporum mexicanum TaxID=3457544 RepID=UPI00029FD068|nr:DUF4335 domain-containing protein [Pseudanabaena sp. PCC 7367]AFY70695.1 hypothetical protein Pse7367_2434 [Pseudanabaena sp. PCC 7367]